MCDNSKLYFIFYTFQFIGIIIVVRGTGTSSCSRNIVEVISFSLMPAPITINYIHIKNKNNEFGRCVVAQCHPP